MEDYVVIYAIVPNEIYKTKLLTPEEKLIAERIIYLCKKEGFCWITNKALAKMYDIRVETASRHIKHLEEIGLIKCYYERNEKNTRRVVQLVDDVWTKWSNRDKSNSQKDIERPVKHNRGYNKRREYKENLPDWFTNPELCKDDPPSEEEIVLADAILDEIHEWSEGKNE